MLPAVGSSCRVSYHALKGVAFPHNEVSDTPSATTWLRSTPSERSPSAFLSPTMGEPPARIFRHGRRICYAPNLGQLVLCRPLIPVHRRRSLGFNSTCPQGLSIQPSGVESRGGLCPHPSRHCSVVRGLPTEARTKSPAWTQCTTMTNVTNTTEACDYVAKPSHATDGSCTDAERIPPAPEDAGILL